MLSIGGFRIRIRYVYDAPQFDEALQSNDLVVAWLEEKDPKKHYFLFRLGSLFCPTSNFKQLALMFLLLVMVPVWD